MTIVRCECCLGKKTIVGLGNIARKCPGCKGMGYRQCDDLASVQDIQDVDEPKSDVVYNDSLPSLSKKELQSIKMKEVWSKRKAEQAGQ